jgi:hypothetical protein
MKFDYAVPPQYSTGAQPTSPQVVVITKTQTKPPDVFTGIDIIPSIYLLTPQRQM